MLPTNLSVLLKNLTELGIPPRLSCTARRYQFQALVLGLHKSFSWLLENQPFQYEVVPSCKAFLPPICMMDYVEGFKIDDCDFPICIGIL